jgi:large subunit ribosomal protein L9
MKVILVKDNTVKEVSDGYARNYLLPNKLAMVATPTELAKREKHLKEDEAKRKEQQALDRQKAKDLEGKTYTLEVDKVGTNNKLFGSVTAKEIASLTGLRKEYILLETPLKEAGEHKIEVKLGQFHTFITIQIKGKK